MRRKLGAIWDLLFAKDWVFIKYKADNFTIHFSSEITTDKILHCQMMLEIGKGEIADMEKAVDEANKIING